MKTINLTTEECFKFDAHTTPEWAVAYGYCSETKMLSWLFNSCVDNNGEWQKLPFIYGKHSVLLGDWAAIRQRELKHGN